MSFNPAFPGDATPGCSCTCGCVTRPRTYPTDLTDAQWAVLEPLLPVPLCQTPLGGRPELCPQAGDLRPQRVHDILPVAGVGGGAGPEIADQPGQAQGASRPGGDRDGRGGRARWPRPRR